MGRNSGYIAMFVGLATGADFVNIPKPQQHLRNLYKDKPSRR